jgi:hypothetical protein
VYRVERVEIMRVKRVKEGKDNYEDHHFLKCDNENYGSLLGLQLTHLPL